MSDSGHSTWLCRQTAVMFESEQEARAVIGTGRGRTSLLKCPIALGRLHWTGSSAEAILIAIADLPTKRQTPSNGCGYCNYWPNRRLSSDWNSSRHPRSRVTNKVAGHADVTQNSSMSPTTFRP